MNSKDGSHIHPHPPRLVKAKSLIMNTSLDLSIVSEIKLTYKNRIAPSKRPTVNSAHTAYELFLNHWDEDDLQLCETFKAMYLNRANKVLGIVTISKGSIAGTLADPVLIFSGAIKALAKGIILAHNHPSGNVQPSHVDLRLTKRMVEAGKILEIPVLDHVILTDEGFYSFAEEGHI